MASGRLKVHDGMFFVRQAEARKAAQRARALRDGRREAAQWGDLAIGVAIAPFPGPFGPILVPNPKYFVDRKHDDGRSTELARAVGAHAAWAPSAGPVSYTHLTLPTPPYV